MEHATIDDVENEPHLLGVNTVRKPLAKELGTSAFALTYFELDPGESFSGGPHTHHDQEEAFYVLSGTATFQVSKEPDEEPDEVEVDAGEVVFFEAGGAYQHGFNDGEEPVVGFAVGAPGARHDPAEIETVVPCPDCGEATAHGVEMADEETLTVVCERCGYRQ